MKGIGRERREGIEMKRKGDEKVGGEGDGRFLVSAATVIDAYHLIHKNAIEYNRIYDAVDVMKS